MSHASPRPVARVDEIRARRRIAMRIGLVVIVLASATACIFDKSDYQGGGRIDHGATAATQTATTTDTIPTSQPTGDSGGDGGGGTDATTE